MGLSKIAHKQSILKTALPVTGHRLKLLDEMLHAHSK